MNIFVLDKDPITAASYLCDKHIVSQVRETTMLLSTVSYKLGKPGPTKPTHKHHPVTKWIEKSKDNWNWALVHGFALVCEFAKRYRKEHMYYKFLIWLDKNGEHPNEKGLTSFVQAMPDKYKCDDAIIAYRNYYLGEKMKFAKWKYTEEPFWIKRK